MTKKVIVRFAPSPTGFLHIGGVRTALFNYLYAKRFGGEFLLRIEDTDQKRSTQEAIEAIVNGLIWLELDNDKDVVFQSRNRDRHVEVAEKLVELGKAYYCYIDSSGSKDKSSKSVFRSNVRNCQGEIPKDKKKLVIRMKVPDSNGGVCIDDKVKGIKSIPYSAIEDFVLLRSDGTPTYMLAVVVDDYDMGITHVIRGDDHMYNTAKQVLVYEAMGWEKPIFVHIPLIHGNDGAKLSKRHGALGIEEYRKMGFLPAAIRNYLLRLGWSCGDEEIISDQDAIKLFDFNGIGKSPSCFNMQKLLYLNNYYMKNTSSRDILCTLKREGFVHQSLSREKEEILVDVMPLLTERAKTLVELSKLSRIFTDDEILIDEQNCQLISEERIAASFSGGSNLVSKEEAELIWKEIWNKDVISIPNFFIIAGIINGWSKLEEWNQKALKKVINDLVATQNELQKGVNQDFQKIMIQNIYYNLRAVLTGTLKSPSIIKIAEKLGKKRTLERLNRVYYERQN